VEDLKTRENHERFFAGLPNVPKTKPEGMAIYPVFIQHIMYSLNEKGRAAIVVPTGFITAQSGIERKIRERLVEKKMLRGVISMPSNIFATTGTNVSILFLDRANAKGDIVLMDASKLGETVKEGKNQKTVLRKEEEDKIISTFNEHVAVEDFSVVVSYEQIAEKNYSLSAGQYFDVKIEYTDITPADFAAKMKAFQTNLDSMFAASRELEREIQEQLKGLRYE
jgi:type I restriction enzyme M protein